jgi:hypothetical protein
LPKEVFAESPADSRRAKYGNEKKKCWLTFRSIILPWMSRWLPTDDWRKSTPEKVQHAQKAQENIV